MPLLPQRRRDHDKDPAASLRPALRDDERRFDRLSKPDLIRQQNALGKRRPQGEERSVHLVRVEIHSGVAERARQPARGIRRFAERQRGRPVFGMVRRGHARRRPPRWKSRVCPDEPGHGYTLLFSRMLQPMHPFSQWLKQARPAPRRVARGPWPDRARPSAGVVTAVGSGSPALLRHSRDALAVGASGRFARGAVSRLLSGALDGDLHAVAAGAGSVGRGVACLGNCAPWSCTGT